MTNESSMTAIGWNFDNSYSLLPKSFYRQVNPAPVQSPKLVLLNSSLAESPCSTKTGRRGNFVGKPRS